MTTGTLTRPEAPAPSPPRPRSLNAGLTVTSAVAVLLATLSLHAVIQGWSWLGPSIAGLVVAVACGELGRRLRGPSFLLPLITPVGLALLVTAVGAGQTAWLGFIPRTKTPEALGHVVRSALDDINTLTAPVPSTHGFQLLAAAGVFAVAALTDLVAVTLRRPALAVVPLATLLIVSATVPTQSIGWLTIGAAIVGWLVLLAVDGRLREREWGRPLAGRTTETGTLGGTGGRIALVALVGGLLLPTVLQTSTVNAFHNPALDGDGNGTGVGGERRIAAPLVTVRSRLRDPKTYTVAQDQTEGSEYLRLTSLDIFDGREFTLDKDSGNGSATVEGDLGDDSTQGSTAVDNSYIQFSTAFQDYILPVPYSPVRATIVGGRWVLSDHLRAIFSTTNSTAGASVTVTSHVPNPTPAQLRALSSFADTNNYAGVNPISASQLEEDLALPKGLPPAITALARRVTAGPTDRYDRALALATWFSDPKAGGGFTYDLAADVPDGVAGIISFLKNKHGYCEQFASTYVVMARALGIPARVAVGFTAGTETSEGQWTITNHDAHAWPEVYFAGQGWVRFEPTPRQDTAGQQPSYAVTRPVPAKSPLPSTAASAAPSADKLPSPKTKALPSEAAAAAAHRTAGGGHGLLWSLVVLLGVALLSSIPGALGELARAARRRRAAHGDASAAWAELSAVATDAGIVLPRSLTPRRTGQKLSGSLSAGHVEAHAALERVVRSLERSTYAPGGPTGAVSAGDLALVRRGILARLDARDRFRATALPRSWVASVREAAASGRARLVESVSARVGALAARLRRG